MVWVEASLNRGMVGRGVFGIELSTDRGMVGVSFVGREASAFEMSVGTGPRLLWLSTS